MTIAKVSIPTAAHDAFGCAYPMTYRWTLPSGSSDLTARARYGLGAWFDLDELPAGALGIDGVRFDYAGDQAFISVAFGPDDDDLHLKLVDLDGVPVGTLAAVEDYYDARDAACVLSWDDWMPEHHADFVACVEEHRDRGLWCSTGINAGGVPSSGWPAWDASHWADAQALVDAGYLEPINHGYTHADPDDVDYDVELELGEGVQAIVDNLTLPPQSRRGVEQYVLGWMEPWGRTNAALQAALAGYRLINQRRTGNTGPSLPFASFDSGLGVFARQQVSCSMDDDSVATMNDRFDTTLAAGGIYHAYGHPWAFDFATSSPSVLAHLDHLAGRNNVWYVGWGHLYVYRYAALNLTIDAAPERTWQSATLQVATS